MDGHDVETVVEILAKRAVANQGGQIAVGRGDQANIHLAFGGLAHPLDLARLQYAQQFTLGLQADIAHLVEKERALVGGLEQALLVTDRPGKRPANMPEQLALQQGRSQRGAIAGQQRMIAAATQPMQSADDHLLTRPALSGHQYGTLGRSNPLDQREDLLHGPRFGDDPLEAAFDL